MSDRVSKFITVNNGDMIEYLKITRNVDDMLDQFKRDRNYVTGLAETDLNKLIVNLWTPSSPICCDTKCLFNMGKTQQIFTLEERIEGNITINESVLNYYTCPQCKNVKRLIDFKKNKINEPFYIECGNLAGQRLIITETPISKLYIIQENPPKSVAKLINNPWIKTLERCSSGCNDKDVCQIKTIYNYIGTDPFSNNTLINWILNDRLEKLGIPNVIQMHTAFVCNRIGFSLYEYPDIGRVRHLQEYSDLLEHSIKPSPTAKADTKVPITKDTVKGIIMQLFGTLHALRTVDFSHGNPCSRSILFKKDPVSYLYNGVHIECPITMKLCDFAYSGITINSNRFYNKSVIADEEISKKQFKPVITTTSITPFTFNQEDISEITIYRLKDPQKYFQEAMMFMYLKHLGLPLYQSSFDAYAFMISLMADRAFYITLMNDESMYLLWRRMWLPEEFEKVQDKILKLHESPDPMTRVEKVLRFLADLGLRCDMIDYGWDMIKTW